MPDGVSALLHLMNEFGTGNTSLDTRKSIGFVDPQHLLHLSHIDSNYWSWL